MVSGHTIWLHVEKRLGRRLRSQRGGPNNYSHSLVIPYCHPFT
jgi:hypothetical protein